MSRYTRPIPVTRPPSGLFGFAPSPFVEGDFVAAVQRGDGRWTVVAPEVESFPNSWQRRVLLWFALSLLIVAPLAWAFARRIVQPPKGFARAPNCSAATPRPPSSRSMARQRSAAPRTPST